MSAVNVPAVFWGTFMRTIVSSLRDRSSWLHKSALKSINRLLASAEPSLWAREEVCP